MKMLNIRKTNMLATALSPSIYDKLISVSKEKGFSLSEFVLMSVAMQLNRKNYKFKKIGRTSEKKKIITVRVSEGLSYLVDKAAKEYGCSRSKFISTAIENWLNYVSKG
jgi:uncharacterized protein (DUF1778 family)